MIFIKKLYLKIFWITVLSLGATSVSSAATLITSARVEIVNNAILGSCRVVVVAPPNPISYAHECDLITRLAGNESVIVREDIDARGVPLQAGLARVSFQSNPAINLTPSTNCSYCTRLRNIEVKDSSGTILIQSSSDSTTCRKSRTISL